MGVMTVIGPIVITALTFTTPNNNAKQLAVLATYKQTGMESRVNYFVKENVKKEWEKPAAYIYQANELLLQKRITFSFSF
jgi:hypothetical protein